MDLSGKDGAEAGVMTSEVSSTRSQLSIYQPETEGPGGLVALGGKRPSADWSATIDLVERAAATIKAYEARFLQLETHTRALMQRTSEEHARLQIYIASLENRLEESERRASKAESAAHDAEIQEREASLRWKRAEARAHEADAKMRQSEAYLRRVHHLLAGV